MLLPNVFAHDLPMGVNTFRVAPNVGAEIIGSGMMAFLLGSGNSSTCPFGEMNLDFGVSATRRCIKFLS